MSRLFIALALPAAVRAPLAALARASSAVPGVRWGQPAQVHLTLRFLGETPEDHLPRVQEALGRVQAPSFRLHQHGMGVFPGPARPQVLWAGVVPHAPLLALAAQVEAAVCAAGCLPERRPFHPHITLARLHRPDRAWVQTFLARHRDFEAGPFVVSDFRLYTSLLRPAGAVHTAVAVFPLS
jgi:2'-5' RNA ligase